MPNNPNGPYPGRQIFHGVTADNRPCCAYLVTGRSPESRQRKAVQMGDVIRIGPLGNQAYDPLRHYVGIKIDNQSGIAVVSNGIQTEAIFEMYKLIYNTASIPGKDYLEKILDGAGAEPDSYHTPRIAGIVTYASGTPVLMLGLKGYMRPARAQQIDLSPGVIMGISTYKGSMENPEAREPDMSLPKLDFTGTTAQNLAEYVFEISTASNQGNDIRVCAVGGVRGADGSWKLAIKNVNN